ncbi:MAG TPA: MOSC N-terminal beta barrel domain-containing protein [Dermatophilaceae bacterium]|nr:MOSC N-terminal beta barrel domain-containing protein [Dermatophilaceae bacterium]
MTYAVSAIWRFPVKSMGGESLTEVALDTRGLVGDREWAVYDAAGKLASGKMTSRFRRMDPVFALAAETLPNGGGIDIVLPSGERVRAGEGRADVALSEHFGEEVEVAPESDVQHQDAGQVSLVGSATLDELARLHGLDAPLDVRHLRANLVVDTDEPFLEESWVGRELAFGATLDAATVVLRVVERIERCRMVDLAQVEVAEVDGLLRTISDQRNLCTAVYADVVTAGTVRIGDVVVPR